MQRRAIRWVMAASVAVGGCASSPASSPRAGDAYVVAVPVERSESANAYEPRPVAGAEVPQTSIATEATAYGRGDVRDQVSWGVKKDGDQTVFVVSGQSWVFPKSGRGEANSNLVAITPSAEARSRVDALISACSG